MTIKQPIPYYGGDRRKMLRETARVFLETGSLSETARRLGLHHSTVINRLRRAREEGCFPNPSKKAMGNISIPDPPEWREPYRTIDITEGEKYGVISDIHVPYYDRIALESALRALVQEEVDGLIISGDYWDCASISWWERTPKERSISNERDVAVRILESIRRALPGAKILYLSGNHEERLPRYLMRTAPELAELSELTIPALLGLSGLGIEWYDERTHLVLGGLHVIHGHEYRVGRGVVNPAKITPDRTRRPVLTGHYHTASEYTHRDIEEHVSAAWTVPCLCDLHPPYYRLPHQWGHGYAIVERTDHGFRCRVKRIINGEIF